MKCIFGHDWEYTNYVGIQSQPVERVCLRCKKHQFWTGERRPDFKQAWFYCPQLWKTKKEIEEDKRIATERKNKLLEIKNNLK